MINEWVKSQRRNRIVYKVSEYLPTKYLLQRIKKKLYSEKNYRLYLNQTNLISPVMGQIDQVPLIRIHREEHSITSVTFLPKVNNIR